MFPEELGVVGVYFLGGGTDGKHDQGVEKEIVFGCFQLERRDEDVIVRWIR